MMKTYNAAHRTRRQHSGQGAARLTGNRKLVAFLSNSARHALTTKLEDCTFDLLQGRRRGDAPFLPCPLGLLFVTFPLLVRQH